jgi:hypothetical protein
VAPGAGAEEAYVLPVFAYHLPGVGDNLWSSEIYVSNPGVASRSVRLGEFLPGRMTVPVPCGRPQGVPREVPPLSTIIWSAADIAVELGCATEAVGALEFSADGPLVIASRMVNEQGVPEAAGTLISGFGLEVPAVELAEAVPPGRRVLLPGLAWHPESCDDPAFETAVGIVNLDQEPVTVVLTFPSDTGPATIFINGEETASPFEFTVRRRGWKQVSFNPPLGTDRECKPAELFDLILEASGSVVAYATVVDRSTQDGRLATPASVESTTDGGG